MGAGHRTGGGALRRERLWSFAKRVYARVEVAAILLELQDRHGQCVCFLLWTVWLAQTSRVAEEGALLQAAELSQAWEESVTGPLRGVRRHLKAHRDLGEPAPPERLRNRVAALELDAERLLLAQLEKVATHPSATPSDPVAALKDAVGAWGAAAPQRLLERLVAAAA